MHVKEKIEWVLALLIDRLNECKKEEAELFVTKFEYSPNENKFRFYHVYNEESFENFIKIFKYNPRGGETNIGRHIDYIADEINIHKKLNNLNIDLSKEKVEILILNDGEDSIKTNSFKWKTNAISLYKNNEQLKKLCINNKGKYINVQGEDAKQIYEFEG